MSLVKVRCANNSCGKLFSFPTPKDSGVYKVKCPHCSLINEVTLEIPSAVRSITCGNAACGQSFTYNLPSKPGIFILKCPICQQANRVTISETAPSAEFKVVGTRLLIPTPKPAAPITPPARKEEPVPLQRPDKKPVEMTENRAGERSAESPAEKLEERYVETEMKELADKAVKPSVKKTVEPPVERPSEESAKVPAEQSYKKSADDDYDADDFFEDADEKETPAEENRCGSRPDRGADSDFDGLKLVKGGIFFRKEYNLTEGHHIIGRFDKTGESHSDFEIKDRTASLRSLRIDVSNHGGEYEYVLTVLRAFNPVKLNGVAMDSGDRAELCHGDKIQLGLTKLKVV